MKAYETTATVKDKNQLQLDSSLPLKEKDKVRLLILLPDEYDIEEKEWYKLAEGNPAFDFLKEPEEDIYSSQDGKPFNDKG